MRTISTIPSVYSLVRQRLLPRQRLGSNLDRPNIPTSITSLLPRLDVPVIDEIAVKAQFELQGEMDHGQRTLREVLGVKPIRGVSPCTSS
jgi:hypothetical protein